MYVPYLRRFLVYQNKCNNNVGHNEDAHKACTYNTSMYMCMYVCFSVCIGSFTFRHIRIWFSLYN